MRCSRGEGGQEGQRGAAGVGRGEQAGLAGRGSHGGWELRFVLYKELLLPGTWTEGPEGSGARLGPWRELGLIPGTVGLGLQGRGGVRHGYW